MGTRPQSHRAPTLARREALLRAALDVVAQRGIGGATHRAIAARAGLPASTTSYFFASIDDLLLEALRHFVAEQVARIDLVSTAVTAERLSPRDGIDRFAELLTAVPVRSVLGQFSAYIEVARRPELREEMIRVLAAFERLAAAALSAAGSNASREGARALVALADGFALHRLVRGDGDATDARALREGMRALYIAYTMDARTSERWDRRMSRHAA